MPGQNQSHAIGTRLTVLLGMLLASWNEMAAAQPRPEFWPPEALPQHEARVIEVPSSIDRELGQVDVLIEAEAWEEAVDAVVRLVDRSADELVGITDNHYLVLADACRWRVARWPAAAREAYRSRVDATAESMLEQALARRDTEELQQLVDRYFASSAGDQALLALADLALQRGEYTAARGYLMQLSPALWTPAGRPWGLALQAADLERDEVRTAVRRQFDSPRLAESLLVYPDTDVPVAEILARLAVTSAREGSLARAEAELDLLQLVAPEAQGRIGGRQAVLAEAVKRTLNAAGTWPQRQSPSAWPTFGGSPARGVVAAPLGSVDRQVWYVELDDPPLELAQPEPQMWLNGVGVAPATTRPAPPRMAQPLTNDRAVVFHDAGRWRAIDRSTGEPLFGETGEVYRESGPWDDELRLNPDNMLLERLEIRNGRRVAVGVRIEANAALRLGGRADIALQPLRPPSQTPGAVPTETMAALDGTMLYAVLGPRAGEASARQPERSNTRRLLALDLAAEGRLQLEIAPPNGYHFSGPPLVTANHLYAPLRQADSGNRLLIACYQRTSGRQIWQVPVCSFVGEGARAAPDILTRSDGRLMVCTSAGVVAAVRSTDGRIAWARTYRRAQSTLPGDLSAVPTRATGPCLAAGGVVVCAPVDCAAVFALDPATGRTLWVNRQATDASELLAVAGGRLVATGARLWLIDVATGATQFTWPDVATAELAGQGRGFVAGDELFWPTSAGIYAFSVRTGRQTRSPIAWQHLGGAEGASLLPCADGLLVATNDRLTLLGSETQVEPARRTEPPSLGQAPPVPGSALTARRQLQSN